MFLFCLFAYFVCDHGYTCAMYGTCVIRSQIHVNAGHRAFEASAIFFLSVETYDLSRSIRFKYAKCFVDFCDGIVLRKGPMSSWYV